MFIYEIDYLNEDLRIEDYADSFHFKVEKDVTDGCENDTQADTCHMCTKLFFSRHYKNSLLLMRSAGYNVHRYPNKQLDICVKSNQMDLPYKYLLIFCCNQTVYGVNVGRCPRAYMFCMYTYIFWFNVAQTNRRPLDIA